MVSSPTGSGKSTELPRWCGGRVLVVEPRRIACQSLAARVADLEGTPLGDGVGYAVRDDRKQRPRTALDAGTRIVFATPGIVLRDRALLDDADVILLDEFHERSLDGDLLLALLLARPEGQARLVVLSATIDGARVAAHLGGRHLSAEGRTFPVSIRYTEHGDAAPDPSNLPRRVTIAIDAAANDPGDILVFLPGRAEIDAVESALRGRDLTVVPLHGGLALEAQRAAFAPAPHRIVILATNVAETSLTVPGIGVVIDTGLVRRTRYHDGRGFLGLGAIAEDSAAQRSGRAGRTAPGVSYRLWGAAATLAPMTPPAIYRESLVPLVLAAASFGHRPEDLRFLDAPKPFALAAARADLQALGALDRESGRLSDEGRALFALPVDVAHGRLLSESARRGCLEDAIDLVAVLSVGRPLFLPGPPPANPHDDLRLAGCDVTALVRAIRIGIPSQHALSGFVLAEARRARTRLRRTHGLRSDPSADGSFDAGRDPLVQAAMAADGRTVHVLRARGQGRAFSNGGTEVELARDSAVWRLPKLEAVVVLESRALGAGRDGHVLITTAAAIPLAWIAAADLGEDRLAEVSLERGRIVAIVEQVYANKVVAKRERALTGALARDAIATLFLRGSLFKEAGKLTRERLALGALAAKIGGPDAPPGGPPFPSVEEWVRGRVADLGVASADDLALLSPADLTAPDVPSEVRQALRRDYPQTVSVGDATYAATYDLDKSQVLLKMVRGNRKDPPPLGFLPRFVGLRIVVEGPRGITVLRGGG